MNFILLLQKVILLIKKIAFIITNSFGIIMLYDSIVSIVRLRDNTYFDLFKKKKNCCIFSHFIHTSTLHIHENYISLKN